MFKWLRNFGRKASPTQDQILRDFIRGTETIWTGHDYRALSINGYNKNVIAYTCITAISNACANVPVTIKINGQEVDQSSVSGPKARLVKAILQPNPKQSYNTFMQAAVSHRLIGGNTYIHALRTLNNELSEMSLLRPDRIQILTQGNCVPYTFQYNLNGEVLYFPIDVKTGLSDEVLQIKTFASLDDLYGMGNLAAARMSVDQHNSAGEWNKNLLDNSSRLSGALSMVDRKDNASRLTEAQMLKIKTDVNDKLTGKENAGKIAVFNYEMKFDQLSLSPVDMDWLNGKQSSARDIAMAFNYPAILLGFPEGQTFNNVETAKLSLYEDTVIPLLTIMLQELSHWLSQHLNFDIQIIPDLDQVSALAPRRESARNNARLDLAAGIISTNEAREEIGYKDVIGGGEILVPAGKLPLNFDYNDLAGNSGDSNQNTDSNDSSNTDDDSNDQASKALDYMFDETKYEQWLLKQGFDKDMAKVYAKIAFTKDMK